MAQNMSFALLKRAASTRYIFLLSCFAFLVWSLAASVAPKASTLSALLQMDFDPSLTQPFIDATNVSLLSNLLMLNLSTSLLPWNPGGIGVPNAHLYVVSLAGRQDRREQMEFLRTIQGLTWTIIDAVPRNATIVERIFDWVAVYHSEKESNNNNTSHFYWPQEINALAVSQEPLSPSGSDTWPETLAPLFRERLSGEPSTTRPSLVCATEDDSIPTFPNGTPTWMVLSPAKIACWHSHILAIRRFVEQPDSDDSNWRHRRHARRDDVAIILEDDIDMEKDIAARLSQVWSSLPAGWDIVFLGHCWSDEEYYPALTRFVDTNIHPSRYPKCTHAYALSYTGARRLLQHLRHPPFAYSRALDQAYAWLVRSGRLQGYSVVPSVVVQRKNGRSDILPGSGSEWRESLRNGVFEG